MSGKKDVVGGKGGDVAVFDYGADAGAGFEGIRGKDLSIPFIVVLQANSPQVEGNSPAGAKSGMLLNSVTDELTEGKKGIVFQPCVRDDKYNEWVPRDNGGGLVDRHDPASDVVKQAVAASGKKFGKLRLKNGNDLVETYDVYGLVLDDKGETVQGFAVVSCSSTKIGPFKKWFTNMYMLKGKPPLFAHRIIIRTVDDENKKGKFKNFDFVPLKGNLKDSLINPVTDKALLDEGKQFAAMVNSGVVKAAFSTLTPDAGPHDDGSDDGKDADGDGKAPF